MKKTLRSIIATILVLASVLLCCTSCNIVTAIKNRLFPEQNSFPLDGITITDIPKFSHLGHLVIEDSDKTDSTDDTIAKILKRYTPASNLKTTRDVKKNDYLAYCYMATDSYGNIFFSNNMNTATPSYVQLGLETNNGLDKAISDAVLSAGVINDCYVTSSTQTVGYGDVVAVSYFVMEEGETMGKVEYNEYTVIGDDEFSKHLIGAQPGVMLDTQFCVAVEEDGIAFVRNYANVVVEYIVKDNSIQTVADMDTVFISYEVSFDVEEYRNTTYGGYDIPENFASDFDYEIIDGKLTARVNCAPMVIYADAEDTPIRERSFTDRLIGAVPGNIIPSITVYDDVVGQVEYTDIQIHSIVNQVPSSPITFKYTPYLAGEVDHLEATVKNIYGTEINLLDTELTYAIYPVNYLDVEEFTARFILFNFYGTVLLSTHDENLNAVYNLNLLNDEGYKCVPDESVCCDEADVGKTLLELTTELRELGIQYHKKYDTMNEALTYLKVVQGNYANYAGISEMERHELEVKLANAKTAYVAVRVEKELAEVKMNTKIAAILCCKKGDLTVEDAIVNYCRGYIASGGATFVTYPHLNLIPTE